MNNQEKIKQAIDNFHESINKQSEVDQELSKAKEDVMKKKEEVCRVLRAVYGDKQRPVIYPGNGLLYRILLKDEGLAIEAIEGEML